MEDDPRVRFGEVAGLKGLAVLAIVGYQAVRFAGLPAGAPGVVARLFGDASQGLTLFLVISAFALAYPPLAAVRAGGTGRLDIRRYGARRLLRIAPAYVVVVGAAAGLAPVAALFGLPILAAGMPAFDLGALARAVVFGGDGLGNDGFRAVDLIVRSYVIFPVILAIWIRLPAAAVALALGAAGLDIFTAAHGWGVGALVPLVLGIAAADLRIRGKSFGRFGVPFAVAAAVAAWFAEPNVAQWTGAIGAVLRAEPHVARVADALGGVRFGGPHVAQLAGALGAVSFGGTGTSGDLRIDPLWALAAFGLLVTIGGSPVLTRAAGFAPLRLLGAASYAISLAAMPVCAFAGHQISAQSGPVTAALAGAGATLVLGFVLWQTVDRWFGDAGAGSALAGSAFARSTFARRLAGLPNRGVPSSRFGESAATEILRSPDVAGGSAPHAPEPLAPPLPAGPVAVLSTRSGSAADFAAEIVETKRRLSEAPAAFFALQLDTAVPNPTAETADDAPRIVSSKPIHLRIGPGTRPATALTTLRASHPSTSSG